MNGETELAILLSIIVVGFVGVGTVARWVGYAIVPSLLRWRVVQVAVLAFAVMLAGKVGL
jgi:hypothetical protein